MTASCLTAEVGVITPEGQLWSVGSTGRRNILTFI